MIYAHESDPADTKGVLRWVLQTSAAMDLSEKVPRAEVVVRTPA
jgi:hypothetical protein